MTTKTPLRSHDRARQIDRIAAAWARQIAGPATVGTALLLGGELRAAISAALGPTPTPGGLARFILHGRAHGFTWLFVRAGERPTTYRACPTRTPDAPQGEIA